MAYAHGLQRIGVLSEEECARIVEGLQQVEREFSDPDYPLPDALEDIHMAVERRLTEIVGSSGGKIHTGRSRNDQVNLDERLYLRKEIASLRERIVAFADAPARFLRSGICRWFSPDIRIFSRLSPFCLLTMRSLFWMLERDGGRLADAWKRADYMPLGSGALAGSTFPIDREFLRDELGFAAITPNSLDAVSDRDFLVETLSALSILMMHLSRFCEDLIVWSSAEFGFVELSDAFSTGSSMMPQKKTPIH